jgi:hypothetical protein
MEFFGGSWRGFEKGRKVKLNAIYAIAADGKEFTLKFNCDLQLSWQ